ncbi:Fe(3+)-hydroxamate ABC transporter permease FhuB [Vibrio albus]|uniref:Fe(3+)-hydroxamate ABC transporter permease FhuB n=1 Tax=Vibrio albus TaxID=2200953 RepID=A0A2U3B6R2_9VIBR|nr:Fe(3+)-hydroxamate ABC transporter permease FhuB [Vibrio albus]
MTIRHFLFPAMLLLSAAFISLQINQSLSWQHQLTLAFTPFQAESFADFNFVYAQLPRVVITLLVGATLGLVGSLMQQLTQNHLTSPFTLGTSSGAWLALVILSVFLPDSIPDFSAMAAMGGALTAFAFILLITGLKNITGLPLVISGMVVNILFGSLATAIILLNQQYAQNVFMWGAGDLAQNGWDWVLWLLPRLSLALPLLIVAPRILLLLRLGQEGAAARGLPVVPVFLLLMISGIWLVSAAITAVGLIGFIGLLTPNISRALGARTAKEELYTSLLLGALLLILTDILSMAMSEWTGQLIPSGVTAAAIGAPALIWFNRKKMKAQDNMAVRLPDSRTVMNTTTVLLFCGLFITAVILYLLAQPNELQWQFAFPNTYQWELRWPRAITAMSAGAGLAVAGTILQRLLYNPLASPDILGVSSGATFALVFSILFFGQSLLATPWLTAMIGSLVVLCLLLLLGKRHQYAPSSMILTGHHGDTILQHQLHLRADQQPAGTQCR